MRKAIVDRKTKETQIKLTLNLDGKGDYKVNTGVPFLDHMLELFTRHAGFDLTVQAKGDIHVDGHHTVEDIGICLGEAIKKALGDKKGIRRYGFFILPMDEVLCQTALDLSNRPLLRFDVQIPQKKTGHFDTELVHEFFQAVSNQAGITLHISTSNGSNAHHIIESIFKCFARALSTAVSFDPKQKGIPSTKGIL